MAGRTKDQGFARRALVVISLLVLVLMAWQLRSVFLLAFAAILFAIILDAAAGLVTRATRLGPRLAFAIATLSVLAAMVAMLWLFGRQFVAQLLDLAARLPGAWDELQRRIGSAGLESEFRDRIGGVIPDSGTLFGIVQFAAGGLAGIASGLALALIGGIYLAANPSVYRHGLLMMVPDPHFEPIGRALNATGTALRSWLIGQLATMAITSVAITLGLVAIGVPSPLALGLICGLMGFIPLIGPLIGALPGVLVALTFGGGTLVPTLLLYFVVQQLVGAVIRPLIMERVVSLPPALTLFGLFAVGILLGPAGVLLGGPLIVAAFVLTRNLWVKDALGREI